MGDWERWCVLAAGVAGLVALAGGSTLMGGPWVELSDDELVESLTARRSPILAGSLLAVGGAGTLLWPVAAVSASPAASVDDVWRSLALFSVAAWALGFALLSLAAVLLATVAWRGPAALGPALSRGLLDAAHLATWSISAPLGAMAVVATTVVAVQAEMGGSWLVIAASVKLATVGVEIVGVARRSGWNAGGWAAGASGVATVAWFAVLLADLS